MIRRCLLSSLLGILGLSAGSAVADPVTPTAPALPKITLPSPHYLVEGSAPLVLFPAPTDPIELPMSTETYLVSDLVHPIPTESSGGTIGSALARDRDVRDRELIEQIQSNVMPSSWRHAGGQGRIAYFHLSHALVVYQTAKGHVAVRSYLAERRKAAANQTQIQMHIHLAKVSDDTFRTFQKMEWVAAQSKKDGTTDPVYLGHLDADLMAKTIEMDSRSQVLMRPSMVTIHGSPACVESGSVVWFVTGARFDIENGQLRYTPKNEPHFIGVKGCFTPRMSPDGKAVLLSTTASLTEAEHTERSKHTVTALMNSQTGEGKGAQSPIEHQLQSPNLHTRRTDTPLTLDADHSAVLYLGKRTRTAAIAAPDSALVAVPFLHALTSEKPEVTDHLVMLVRARVINVEEERMKMVKHEVPARRIPESVRTASANGASTDDPLIAVSVNVPVPKASWLPNAAQVPTKLQTLLGQYHRACANGDAAEARRLAMECLVIDPKCFSK